MLLSGPEIFHGPQGGDIVRAFGAIQVLVDNRLCTLPAPVRRAEDRVTLLRGEDRFAHSCHAWVRSFTTYRNTDWNRRTRATIDMNRLADATKQDSQMAERQERITR